MTWLVVSMAALMSLSSSGRASVMLAMSLAELVTESRHVVIATAVRKQARRRGDGRLIVTDVELHVREALKGPRHTGDTLVVTHLGGKLPDVALSVPGEASFALGQPVLVFLRDSAIAGELQVVGMAQGVLPLSGLGQDATVMPGATGASLVQRGADGKLREAPDAMWQPRPLDEVREEIRRLAAGPNGN